MAPNAGWDTEVVTIDLQGLIDLDFEVTLTGFSVAESDVILDASRDADAKRQPGPEDEILPVAEHPVGRVDDLWFLGRRRLLCGDARARRATHAH